MILNSFIQIEKSLSPIQVEVVLLPGLPVVQFLGLPDQSVKESALRIKSAIKRNGFQFPKHHQVLVNLKPNDQRKSSSGLELAVLVAILLETEQLKLKIPLTHTYFYGELGLDGSVTAPQNLNFKIDSSLDFEMITEALICTGKAGATSNVPENTGLGFASLRMRSIKDLRSLTENEITSPSGLCAERPNYGLERNYSEEEARLISLVALGRHSILMAGPAGSGKTTFAKVLNSFLSEPSQLELREMKSSWRPFVSPHHRTPAASLIGGGSNRIFSGQMHEAHGGVLLLDELLEFPSHVLESLRGPLEESQWRVFRQGREMTKPFTSWVVATTNLCPCGERTPIANLKTKCRFSLIKCRSYAQRLSGPLLDRFQLLHFTRKTHERKISGEQILTKIASAEEFAKKLGRNAANNSVLSLADLEKEMDAFVFKRQIPAFGSERRKLATLRVARSLADMEGSERILPRHVEAVLGLCFLNFEKIKMWS